ncbi:amino acid adenylation domain protein [Catenulispora acidiphila DSM 44928]|uniref:Amino acid adenylation domain protein n=1 Tax=Catenulispora acidiphila (strain DSM 44928 / JCM 14897 / NBRC 102108 / NRRL B-24433 / ID139908) TaxID=479433 RepID=C7QK67_CATAD|nr:non-ribosomal peptide synthetase [Catenulispora acidiphila]ACU75141.1 amino acid adenylation domain protein [Catenulispora acidiphila DSM 44928]
MSRRFAALPAQRRARFLARLEEQARVAAARGPVPRRDAGPVPLTQEQQTLRSASQSSAPGTPLCLRLRGDLDVDALRLALAALVARHDALRTAIVEREGGFVQVIAGDVPVRLAVIEADGQDHERRLLDARALIDREAGTPFDLSRTPPWRATLVRVAADDHLFAFDVSRMVCDTWSHGVLIRELGEFYRASRDGEAPQVPDLPVQYPDYALWQRDRLDAGELDTLVAHWRSALAGAEVLEFPTDRPRGDTQTHVGATADFAVGHQGWEKAWKLAREEGVSRFDVLAAAFFTVLHRYSGLTDLVIGAPQERRRHEALSSAVGQFTDMRVLRLDVSGDPTFRELVHRVKRASDLADVDGDGGLPFGKLLDAVEPARDPSRSPIFQIVFDVQNAVTTPALPGIDTSREAVRPGTARFDMSWQLTEQTAPGADASLGIEFNTELFDADSIARFARHYDGMLSTLTSAPDAPLSDAAMLSPEDQEFLADIAVGPVRTIRETTIVEEFQARVQEAPDAVAVVVGGVETSYAKLNAGANRLAALLRERGVEPGARVGICLRRNVDLTTAMLAVLKTGAAYVPLDTTHPSARVAEIAADAGVCAVITHAAVADVLSEVEAPVVTLDEVRAELAVMPAHDVPLAAEPCDVAYVIYTSGSTGKPKGVLLEHRGVVAFIDSVRELFELTPADRMLGFASVTFDVSVFETFSALLTGARLCIATEDERLSIDRLQALMERAGITVIDLPPTVMPLLAPERFTELRIAFVGGEAFSGELVNRWNPGRRLFNGYGPTECTVTMIVEECAGTWDASPPIGLPMANHVAHVLDRDLRPVPIGVPGELVIGGAGLARGYLDRDELTAEKFIADPFGTAPGGRLYRTGDLVKRLADGRLVFQGRIDQQVKIRGLRIELGEVESAVTGFAGIEQVSVRPWADDAGDKHLVCYATGIAEGQVPALREHLSTLLPSYMIPSYFVVLGEMPLTSSGKVDWRRLPAPEVGQAEVGAPVAEARTATERVLLHDVLAPLLRTTRLGVNDDFFLAGGNSLQAVQLMSAINRRFRVEVSLGDFFVSPTVAHLAATIDRARAEQSVAKDEEGSRASVVMRAAGPAQVILMHPSGGELFCYMPLVRALRQDIGVVGFAADPQDAAVDPGEGLAVSAARIAQTLIAGGLPESCCLAGWSYGGVLAFEVARQIEERIGRRVPLVLLDAAYDEDTEPLDEATVRQRFVHDVARLAGRDGLAVRAVLERPDIGGDDIRETLTGLGVRLELTDEELDSRFQTFRACALSMQAYSPPGSYGGPVTALAASPRVAVHEQWRSVCTGRFCAERVPGDHYTLFTKLALSRVVAAIEETLAR